MAWTTDLKEASYTSPSGKKIVFNFDPKLKKDTDLKTVSFTFPAKDGALVIPLGIGGKQFEMSCFFYGDDCSSQADEFENALKECGVGVLNHPLYGRFSVVPTGKISREDDAVSEVGISTVGVTFQETLTESTIESTVETIDEINEKVEKLEECSVKEFVKDANTDGSKVLVKLKNGYKKALGYVSGRLGDLAKLEKDINTTFQTVYNEIFTPIDDIANNLELVAYQTNTLIKLPARVAINSLQKVDYYVKTVTDIINQFKVIDPNFENVKNQWAITRLFLSNLVTACTCGVAESATNPKSENQNDGNQSEQGASFYVGNNDEVVSTSAFASRDEAMEAVDKLKNLYNDIVEVFEKFIALGLFVETGDTYESMRDCFILALNLIIEKSFSLPNKKIIELKSDRQVTELVFELYGNLERLDEFIVDNNLTYNELEIIPAGRKVAYYV